MKGASIHPSASCDSEDIGPNTRIDAFAFIARTAKVGRDCVIGPHVCIGEGVVIANAVTIQGSAYVCEGTIVEDEVRIDAYATFSQGLHSSQSIKVGEPIVLRRGCVIGANATICAGVNVGENSVVNPGAMVIQSVQPYAVVSGNPAAVIAFVDAIEKDPNAVSRQPTPVRIVESKVRGVRAFELPFINDPRGNLTAGEFGQPLPFVPKRYFITFDVPNFSLRGEHAHRVCHQLLLCVRGSCSVVVDDGQNREEFLLDRPTLGIHVPPMIWATEYKHSHDSTLFVFASDYYDPADYIRDYSTFLKEVASSRSPI